MAEQKPRKWFQIHLSTCVVLMFVAGALVWANVQPSAANLNSIVSYGFPLTCYQCWAKEPVEIIEMSNSTGQWIGSRVVPAAMDWGRLAGNVAVSVTALAITAFGSEHFLRRRSRRHD